MMRAKKRFLWLFMVVFIGACQKDEQGVDTLAEENLNFACKQSKLLLNKALENNRLPRTVSKQGELEWARTAFDWTEGFFPGTCWYLYEYSKNDFWKEGAGVLQELYTEHRYFTNNHDLGFIFNSSYGNGYRITKREEYKNVMVDAANSLIQRFKPEVGCIQSWDVDGGWQAKRGWQYPVIIDNMMNLELLFEVAKITNDDKYKQVAITHANTTLKNHFRPSGSSYHVVDYDSISGAVRNKETAQGYSHESVWARGQAWGLYGYTVCYRYTKDKQYLNKALEIATFITKSKEIPQDRIPYWDYDAPKIPKEPRDASAAAITASALLELAEYTSDKQQYLTEANAILKSLSSEQYRAKLGGNNEFILKHSVGSIPHNNEIDVPLSYADYYYVEALMRMLKSTDVKQAKK